MKCSSPTEAILQTDFERVQRQFPVPVPVTATSPVQHQSEATNNNESGLPPLATDNNESPPPCKRKRTCAEKQRAYRERKKGIKKIRVKKPTSPGLANVINKDHHIIEEDCIVHTGKKEILIRVWKNKVTDDRIRVLEDETKRFLAGLPTKSHKFALALGESRA